MVSNCSRFSTCDSFGGEVDSFLFLFSLYVISFSYDWYEVVFSLIPVCCYRQEGEADADEVYSTFLLLLFG